MQMSFLRRPALMLALVAGMGLLVACGSSEEKAAEAPAATETPAAATVEAAPAASTTDSTAGPDSTREVRNPKPPQ